jgi:hypothetical protein
MRKTTNPLYRVATPTSTKHRLLYVLRQVTTRPRRWHRQRVRRYPASYRALTPAEHTLQRLRTAATKLTSLLEPFRRTRLRGHESLRGLLTDLDTQPALVAQVNELRAHLEQVTPELVLQGQQVSAWRQEWEYATPERQRIITEVHKAQAINAYVKGLAMLIEEAKQDISYLELIGGDLLKPTTATAPQQAAPTPYS